MSQEVKIPLSVMESTNSRDFGAAKSSNDVVEKYLDSESNLENSKQKNLSSAGAGENKRSSYKGRNTVKQICRFYMEQNYCRYGRNCRFSHDRSGYRENRNFDREHVPRDWNTTKRVEQTDNRKSIKVKPEIGVEDQELKNNSSSIPKQNLDTSQRTKKVTDKRDGTITSQHSDTSAGLHGAYESGAQTSRKSAVVGRQRNLYFYRSNRGAVSNSPVVGTLTHDHCRYFLKGFCRQGDNCKFLHQEINRDNVVMKTEAKPVEESVSSVKTAREVDNQSKPPDGRVVPTTGRLVKLQDLDENEIARLRNTEIQQLKKRFPAHEVVKSSPEEILCVTFSPSDPDWSFAVNSVTLEVTISTGYPREACTVKVLEANNLPPILVRHLNKSISNWVKEKHEACLSSGKVELLFRPFLRWFDRNLEGLFIVGLRKVKQDLLAKEAGIEFIPYDELPGATAKAHSKTCDTEATECTTEEKKDDSLTLLQESSGTDLTWDEQSAELNNVERNVDEEIFSSDMGQGKQRSIVSDLQCDHPLSCAEKENFSPGLNDTKSIDDSLLISGSPGAEKFSVPKVGTEIKLLGLELTEDAACMVCTKIAATLQCGRCKTRHEINTPPRRNNSLNCVKCHHLLQIVFQPAMLHQFSTVMGYLHLIDCQVVDIPLMECNFSVDCLNCSRQIALSGIHYGQQRITWCLYCNKKMSIYTQSVKFHQLQPASNIATSGHKLTTTTKREKKVVKDPAIQEGKPLPDCGTCKHYKKSYRWLRFPCCGKAYPCDVCHDEKETDHEMKYASRMICGFCAKEQPYAGNRPCVSCSSNMTKKAGSHWEGGKGCRDKITMCREDRQKYSGMGKTISRKAQTLNPPKK